MSEVGDGTDGGNQQTHQKPTNKGTVFTMDPAMWG
jgi:hypothetical protein